jgi:hypothetical protein
VPVGLRVDITCPRGCAFVFCELYLQMFQATYDMLTMDARLISYIPVGVPSLFWTFSLYSSVINDPTRPFTSIV